MGISRLSKGKAMFAALNIVNIVMEENGQICTFKKKEQIWTPQSSYDWKWGNALLLSGPTCRHVAALSCQSWLLLYCKLMWLLSEKTSVWFWMHFFFYLHFLVCFFACWLFFQTSFQCLTTFMTQSACLLLEEFFDPKDPKMQFRHAALIYSGRSTIYFMPLSATWFKPLLIASVHDFWSDSRKQRLPAPFEEPRWTPGTEYHTRYLLAA